MSYFACIVFVFILVGLFVILSGNPIHSILNLILIFFLSSCLAIFLGIEFLALLILIIYVGAISVLFLFVVMLLNVRIVELNVNLIKYWWLGLLYFFFFVMSFYFSTSDILSNFFYNAPSDLIFLDFTYQFFQWNAISQFGELLFLYFPHLLIFSALILFVAIVSPVMLTFVSFVTLRFNPEKEFFFKLDSELKTNSRKNQNIFLQTIRSSFDNNF